MYHLPMSRPFPAIVVYVSAQNYLAIDQCRLILALVSCLGQGPCFSKITYMVTACNYSEGMIAQWFIALFFDFP